MTKQDEKVKTIEEGKIIEIIDTLELRLRMLMIKFVTFKEGSLGNTTAMDIMNSVDALNENINSSKIKAAKELRELFKGKVEECNPRKIVEDDGFVWTNMIRADKLLENIDSM